MSQFAGNTAKSLNDTWQELAEPLIKPILDQASSDPESLISDLASLYPELDADSLTEQLARIIFVADTWARLHTSNDDA